MPRWHLGGANVPDATAFHAIMTRILCAILYWAHPPSGLLGDPVNIESVGTEEQIHQVVGHRLDPR